MLIVLSPAKTLDYTTPHAPLPTTLPRFLKQTTALIGLLREYSPARLATLMGISDKLAVLNADRFAAWSPRFSADNSRPAVLAFAGDVYTGLDAATLDAADLGWAQQHLALLSGLYGVLRPLDLMQPYRLEMGTRLTNPAGSDLYAFWGQRIAETLREQLHSDPHPTLVNLASDEYFSAIDRAALGAPVVQPVFQDGSGGRYKIISFYAKRARGAMARYAIRHRLSDVQELKSFDLDGYAYAADASDPTRWVFRRSKPGTSML
jgi:cytoplasmic iron level regulating protein YaaA (DUF328/UPF0246 family)